MGPLVGLSVSLLALKLGGVSTVSYGLVILPAALQYVYNVVTAIRQKREMNTIIESIEKARENMNKED